MKKHRLIATIAIAGLTLGAFADASDSRRGRNHFAADLIGFQENPSISSIGRGHVDVLINDQMQTIVYTLSYDRLEGTTPFVTNGVVLFSHIHVSARGVNGGVAVFLCGGGGKPACPTPSSAGTDGVIVPGDIVGPAAQGINPGEPTAFAELVRAIRSGFAYVNVHTTRWPGGEIRGQLREVERDDN